MLAAFSAEGLERFGAPMHELTIDGLQVQVISRSHLIQNKRTAGRTQDLAELKAPGAETSP
jgi:hypothetical protein